MTWQDDEQESGDEATDEEHEEGPDASEMSDDPAEVPCPYCKRNISEDAAQCPYCGCYLASEIVPKQRPWWWIAAVVLLLALLITYLLK